MTSPKIRLAVMAAVSALALTACDSEPTPPVTGTSTTPIPSTPTDPENQAPKVRNPLDIKKFVDDPCSSLTATQLADLKLIDPEVNRGDDAYEAEVGCNYNLNPKNTLTAYVNYFPRIKNGLTYIYTDRRPATPSPHWTPTEIDGFPAVVHAPSKDRTRCHVDVGTSDTTFFDVTYYYYDWNDWDGRDTCAAAKSIATAVLTTIKAAN
ncbi:DUF3558 domain-containing protein [Actinophytocola sp. NPDC049390]|uniref:DUF3558 domain-containing protein n=1 Tax=Actinophytocola sp. NPDC049390 TaxID=3363894 RepID=UPI00378EE419